MILKEHPKKIKTVDDWKNHCPPKKGDAQWEDGRSAKELARYITDNLPNVPAEIENSIKGIVPTDAQFEWDAEYVTTLPGRGEGRNHDAVLFGEGVVVTIEAKADEPLGNTVEKEMEKASVNKLFRISKLLKTLYKGGFSDYKKLRYQLMTASVGSVLEAEQRGCKTAVMLVLVFKSKGRVTEEKLAQNDEDIKAFLESVNAVDAENGLKEIPNNTDVKLYFKEIVI